MRGVQLPNEAVRVQFDTARDLFVYSWFVYEFMTVAEHHSYAVLEMAIDLKSEQAGEKVQTWHGLNRKVDTAMKRGWLQRADFEIPAPGDPNQTISMLDVLVRFRNRLAHGKMHLYPTGSVEMMRFTAEVINKLFPATPDSSPASDEPQLRA